jgi:hypothetical protein
MNTLLYSKYSQNSKRMLDLFQKYNINIADIGIQMLCVDNKEVRKRILKNNVLKIELVPCILIPHSDGIVEKYEDQKAFAWAENAIQSLLPPPPSPEELQQQRIQMEQQQQMQMQMQMEQQQIQKQNTKKKTKKNPKRKTVIEEDEDDDENNDKDNEASESEGIEYKRFASKKPKIKIIKNAGNHEEIEPNTDELPQVTPSDEKSRKSSNILAVARELEKEREVASKNPAQNNN